MEYVYAVMLLHKAGKQVDKTSVKKVLDAAGVKVDEAKLTALVASLEGVDIDKVVKEAAFTRAAPVAEAKEEKKPEKKKEEEKPSEEEAAAGLSALFG